MSLWRQGGWGGAGKRGGPHRPGSRAGRGRAGRSPRPRGGTWSSFPLRGSASGGRHKPKPRHRGPRSPGCSHAAASRPSSPGPRALRAGRPSFSPSEPPHQQAAVASKVSNGKQQTRGTRTECSPLLNAGPVGKISDKRSDSWRRDLYLVCISSRAW